MRYVRSFHPVTAFVTFIASLMMLLGLLSGCVSDPVTTPNPEVSQPVAQFDTGVSDTSPPLDQATQDQIALGQLYDKWIAIMDPFVTQNPNSTFAFDNAAFLTSVVSTYPEVVAYYEGTGPATDDTVVIDTLIAGFDVVNPLALADYNEATQDGAVPPPSGSIYYKWYWWGYGQCYTGSYAQAEDIVFCYGVYIAGRYGGYISSAYATYFCSMGGFYAGSCGGFCIYFPWAGPAVSISRP